MKQRIVPFVLDIMRREGLTHAKEIVEVKLVFFNIIFIECFTDNSF